MKDSPDKNNLEVPQEVVGDFEVGTNGEDLVDQILDADDAEFAKPLFDNFVGEGASSSYCRRCGETAMKKLGTKGGMELFGTKCT